MIHAHILGMVFFTLCIGHWPAETTIVTLAMGLFPMVRWGINLLARDMVRALEIRRKPVCLERRRVLITGGASLVRLVVFRKVR